MKDLEKLIFENENIIKKVIFKLKIYRDLDEYMQVGRIALWQASKKYDGTKGDFAMFAYMTVKFAVVRALSKSNYVSQHEYVVEEDILTFKSEPQHLFTSNVEWPEWFDELNEEEQFLLIALYEEGLSVKEIADKYKMLYETIKKRRQRLLLKLKKIVV